MVRSLSILLVFAALSRIVCAQDYAPTYYDTGTPPNLIRYYVDPTSGDDDNSGTSTTSPFRTLDAAWQRIPQGATLGNGIEINLAAGFYPEESIPNFFESRHGSASAPIIFRGVNGTILGGDINMFDCRSVYFIGLTIRPSPAGDTFHCERCDRVLLRGSTFDGGNRQAHETIKFNQSTNIFIENSNIHGAGDNAIDFVAVQGGHIVGNKIHNAQDWCTYVKGGSAFIRVEGNEFYNCGTGGFTAGQGTGFEFMVSPWLHYEAYDIKFFNNIVHDTEGAAVGVNGGFNIVMAHNTFYRVGSRSHGIEVVFGGRSCDGDTARCAAYRSSGGWGPTTVGMEEPIGNRSILIANNVLYNPAGFQSLHEHFAIHPPRTPTVGSGIPSPQRADTNLVIAGNIIWNGPALFPLGIEGIAGACDDSNPTCNETQLRSANSINTVEPVLRAPTMGDYRPAPSSGILAAQSAPIANFTDAGRPTTPAAPSGVLVNSFTTDRGGATRTTTAPPGAYVSAESPLAAPLPEGIPETPTDDSPGADLGPNVPPSVVIESFGAHRMNGRVQITVRVRSVDSDGSIERIHGRVMRRGKQVRSGNLRSIGADSYRRTFLLPLRTGLYVLRVTATDDRGATRTKKRSKRVS
jgi:hypothetical protein